MFSFFRKYQKFLFIVITIVIVFSFVFFGTYQAFGPRPQGKEETSFTTQNGRKITKSYLRDFAHFLNLEPTSARGFQNFLNDSVIGKDILDAQIGYLIVKENGEKINEELNAKLQKEKTFRPYKHPLVAEISAEHIWQSFAPSLKEAYRHLISLEKGEGKEAFSKRALLFIEEKKFPGDILAYVLRMQENQALGGNQDPRLRQDSLSLFGYKDLSDWFGPTFVETAAGVIIEGADYARSLGYEVKKEEIIADILYKREKAFKRMKEQKGHWPNSFALYQDCLHLLQIDEPRLISILEDISLFRRLFQDVSSLNLVDTLSLSHFFEKAHECIVVETFHLPEE
jgi:hypothetical protein